MVDLVKQWKVLARRDDLFTHHMVPSDVRQLVGEIERLRELIADFAFVDDPCQYDHHGYCQAHGWFETDPICPNARAIKVLEDIE